MTLRQLKKYKSIFKSLRPAYLVMILKRLEQFHFEDSYKEKSSNTSVLKYRGLSIGSTVCKLTSLTSLLDYERGMKNRFPMSRTVFVQVEKPRMAYTVKKRAANYKPQERTPSSYCSSISPLFLITSLKNDCSVRSTYASITKEQLLSLSSFLKLFIAKHRLQREHHSGVRQDGLFLFIQRLCHA